MSFSSKKAKREFYTKIALKKLRLCRKTQNEEWNAREFVKNFLELNNLVLVYCLDYAKDLCINPLEFQAFHMLAKEKSDEIKKQARIEALFKPYEGA